MSVLSILQDIFRDILDIEDFVLLRETTSDSIESWDSLAQINIIAACENQFKIKFDLREILKLKSAGDIVDNIEGKLKM